MKEQIKAYNSVLELIGNTPLIKINKVTSNLKGNFAQKSRRSTLDILLKIELRCILLKKQRKLES